MHVHRGDLIEVISGNDRGKRGKVMRVMPKKGQLLAEGIRQVHKHLRRDRRNPQGGRLQKEAAIDISNVLVVCPKCDAGVRVGFQVKENGAKVRICRKCRSELGTAS